MFQSALFFGEGWRGSWFFLRYPKRTRDEIGYQTRRQFDSEETSLRPMSSSLY